MQKFSLVIDDTLAKRVTAKAKKKKMGKATYIRQLIELGLAQDDGAGQNQNTPDSHAILNKKLLSTMLETLYLNRTILLNTDGDKEEKLEQLKQAGIKAKESSEKILSELISEEPS